MSEFEPEQMADDEKTVGAAQHDAAASAADSAASDTEHRDAGSAATMESVTGSEAAVGKEAAVEPEPAVDSETVVEAEPAVDPEGAEELESPVAASPVAAALAELDRLAERPVADHPDIYGRVHAQLHTALSAIDDA